MPTPRASSRIRNFTREWIITGGILVLLGILATWLALTARFELEETERHHLAHQAKVLHDNLVRQLVAINHALVNVREDIPRWRDESSGFAGANHRLKALVEAMIGVRTMSILDAQGRVLASSRPELIGKDFSGRDYYHAARAHPNLDTLYISPPFQTVLGPWAMVAGRMVGAAHSEFAGMVIATLEPQGFNVLLDSVRYAPDMWSALIHGDGMLFLITPQRHDLAGTDLAQPTGHEMAE